MFSAEQFRKAPAVLISDIPLSLHSADLRSFFSNFLEANRFHLFHFRHRRSSDNLTCACIAILKRHQDIAKFVHFYHMLAWKDRKGQAVPQAPPCFIQRIRIVDQRSDNSVEPSNPPPAVSDSGGYLSRRQQRELRKAKKNMLQISATSRGDTVEIVWDDISHLPELHAPPNLPRGNIGTREHEFLTRAAQLPAHLLKSLGISYHVRTGGIAPPINMYTEEERQNLLSLARDAADDETLEEWDREAALNPLPDTSIDRHDRLEAEEYMFEYKVENPWDKVRRNFSLVSNLSVEFFIEFCYFQGDASGHVYYTDALYWDQARGDFDEITADAWDVGNNLADSIRSDQHEAAIDRDRTEERTFMRARWNKRDENYATKSKMNAEPEHIAVPSAKQRRVSATVNFAVPIERHLSDDAKFVAHAHAAARTAAAKSAPASTSMIDLNAAPAEQVRPSVPMSRVKPRAEPIDSYVATSQLKRTDFDHYSFDPRRHTADPDDLEVETGAGNQCSDAAAVPTNQSLFQTAETSRISSKSHVSDATGLQKAQIYMERRGWQLGEGIGKSMQGRAEPVALTANLTGCGIGYGGKSTDTTVQTQSLIDGHSAAATIANEANKRINPKPRVKRVLPESYFSESDSDQSNSPVTTVDAATANFGSRLRQQAARLDRRKRLQQILQGRTVVGEVPADTDAVVGSGASDSDRAWNEDGFYSDPERPHQSSYRPHRASLRQDDESAEESDGEPLGAAPLKSRVGHCHGNSRSLELSSEYSIPTIYDHQSAAARAQSATPNVLGSFSIQPRS
jgi:hypothetical protein